MDPVLSYNFAEIDAVIREDILTTSARFNAALEDLNRQIAPLQQLWTRDAGAAYRVEQSRWQQAATSLHQILTNLAKAVGEGAADLAESDRRAARSWS
jgi:WXG100 family type VII secretion target